MNCQNNSTGLHFYTKNTYKFPGMIATLKSGVLDFGNSYITGRVMGINDVLFPDCYLKFNWKINPQSSNIVSETFLIQTTGGQTKAYAGHGYAFFSDTGDGYKTTISCPLQSCFAATGNYVYNIYPQHTGVTEPLNINNNPVVSYLPYYITGSGFGNTGFNVLYQYIKSGIFSGNGKVVYYNPNRNTYEMFPYRDNGIEHVPVGDSDYQNYYSNYGKAVTGSYNQWTGTAPGGDLREYHILSGWVQFLRQSSGSYTFNPNNSVELGFCPTTDIFLSSYDATGNFIYISGHCFKKLGVTGANVTYPTGHLNINNLQKNCDQVSGRLYKPCGCTNITYPSTPAGGSFRNNIVLLSGNQMAGQFINVGGQCFQFSGFTMESGKNYTVTNTGSNCTCADWNPINKGCYTDGWEWDVAWPLTGMSPSFPALIVTFYNVSLPCREIFSNFVWTTYGSFTEIAVGFNRTYRVEHMTGQHITGGPEMSGNGFYANSRMVTDYNTEVVHYTKPLSDDEPMAYILSQFWEAKDVADIRFGGGGVELCQTPYGTANPPIYANCMWSGVPSVTVTKIPGTGYEVTMSLQRHSYGVFGCDYLELGGQPSLIFKGTGSNTGGYFDRICNGIGGYNVSLSEINTPNGLQASTYARGSNGYAIVRAEPIGDCNSSCCFQMGKSGTFTPNSGGALSLQYNDCIRYDNKYSLVVNIDEFPGAIEVDSTEQDPIYIGEVQSGVTYHYTTYGSCGFQVYLKPPPGFLESGGTGFNKRYESSSFSDANGSTWYEWDSRLRIPYTGLRLGFDPQFPCFSLKQLSLVGKVGECSVGIPVVSSTVFNLPVAGRVYRSGALATGKGCSGVFILPTNSITTGTYVNISGKVYTFENYSDWTGYNNQSSPNYSGTLYCIYRIVSEDVLPNYAECLSNGLFTRLSGSGFGDTGYNITYQYLLSGIYSGNNNKFVFATDYWGQYIMASGTGDSVIEDYYSVAGNMTMQTGFYEVDAGIGPGGWINAY